MESAIQVMNADVQPSKYAEDEAFSGVNDETVNQVIAKNNHLVLEDDGLSDITPQDVKLLQEALDLFNSTGDKLSETNDSLIKKIDQLLLDKQSSHSERQEENQSNNQIEKQFEYLLKTLPVGVVMLSSTGHVSQCNPMAVDLLGEPLLGLKWVDVISRSFSPKASDGHEVSLKDGRLVNISTRSFQEGNCQLIVINDLTETRQLQSRIEKNRRIWELGKMSAALAHQIRTPLSSAMLYTSQLNIYQFDSDKRTDLCERIMQSLQHLEAQVSDILSFVKPDHSHWEWSSLRDIWGAVERSMAASLLANNAKLLIRLETNTKKWDDFKVSCHRDAFQGALINIVQNGIEAAATRKKNGLTDVNPCIEVVLSNEEIGLKIDIIDNGGGIPESIQKQMFDPFFSTKQYGTGLGLAVVKQVMDAHGFDMDITIEKDRGTTFSLHCEDGCKSES